MNNVKFYLRVYANGKNEFTETLLVYLITEFNINNDIELIKCHIQILLPQFNIYNYVSFTFSKFNNGYLILPQKYIYNTDLLKINNLEIMIHIDPFKIFYKNLNTGLFRKIKQINYSTNDFSGQWTLCNENHTMINCLQKCRIITSPLISKHFALQLRYPSINESKQLHKNIQLRMLCIFMPFNIQSISCNLKVKILYKNNITIHQKSYTFNSRKNGKKPAFYAFNTDYTRDDIVNDPIISLKYKISELIYNKYDSNSYNILPVN